MAEKKEGGSVASGTPQQAPTSPPDATSTPESRGLNPGAVEFVPGKPEGGSKKSRGNRGKEKKSAFHMNPSAVPWQPVTRRATSTSTKPLIFVSGAPGGEGEALADKLATEFGGVAFSSAATRRAVAAKRKEGFHPPSSLWGDTKEAVDGLDDWLKTVRKSKAKCLIVDMNSKNSRIYQYLNEVLRKPENNLAPGLFLYVEDTAVERKQLVANMTAKGEEPAAAKSLVDHYFFSEHERTATFGKHGTWVKEAKGLVKWLTAKEGEAKLFEAAKTHCETLFEMCQKDKVLSYDLPFPAPPASVLFPIVNATEYLHVMATLDARVSQGDPRYPLAKDTGCLIWRRKGEADAPAEVKNDSIGSKPDAKELVRSNSSFSYNPTELELVNQKAANPAEATPTAESHMVSRKVEGSRYILMYTAVHNDTTHGDRGKFYLIPKSMEIAYTIRPRIRDVDYDQGQAPLYGEPGALMTFILDGTLAATKTGWGGLVGPGLAHYVFIAGDVLYSSAENKPMDKIVRTDYWTLEKRIHALARACPGWPQEEGVRVQPQDNDLLTLCVKNYHPMSALGEIVDTIEDGKDAYTSVGVTFTPTRKYIPFADPQLISWHLFRYRTFHLRIKRNRNREEGGFLLLAKKEWGSDEEVRVGTVAQSQFYTDGNVVCRAVWKGRKGMPSAPGGPYAWEVIDTAPDCWEVKALREKYLDPKYWVDAELLKQFLKVDEKVKVEKVSADSSPEEVHLEPAGRGGGRGRGR
eukprot:TRINITY_DN19402_c0_g1_i1.p1 TRINITY_DN19402_c0_g1~~TRINITY_DN19402_c0_g1_i1.p1  ORF type:complete len:748 (+),score=236.78 TRINITY_DN19402_c0_g1_i1:45-2288(+)